MEKNYVEFGEDPSGFFYIYLDDAGRKIVVEHYLNVVKDEGDRRRTVSGRLNKVFRGRNAEVIYRTILGNIEVGRADHIAYLGYELGKAETALRNHLNYEQDKPLSIK